MKSAIRFRTIVLVFALSSIALAARTRKSSAAAIPSAGGEALKACGLLTARDIKQAQGEPFSATRETEQRDDNFRLLECFYSTPTAAKSVSLSLALSYSAKTSAAAGPRRFWQERFHSAADKDENLKLKPDGDNDGNRPPLPVSGVGEEAYWMGNRLAGALYVLSGDRFLRISVGGGESEDIKRNKSEVLAKAALAEIQRRQRR